MKTLTIDRSKWARADVEDNGDSALLNTQGCMCCLGFWANQICGISDKTLLNQGTPYCVRDHAEGIYSLEMKKLIDDIGNNNLTHAMMAINDASDIPDYRREQLLRLLFASIDINVKFIN